MKCLFFVIQNYLRKGVESMIMAYCVLIIEGEYTFADVPKRYQARVKALLEKMGLDENGNPIGE